ncbi:MAG TPA: hypothetical protein VK458_05310 [Myxococcaceae bacterium]|nr:hypothetical protein [Myxococcaceae bacterium]
MGFWKQGMAVAVVGLGLMSGEVHAQSAEDFPTAQQVAEPPAPLARDTSDDFTLQSFNGRSVLPMKVRNCWYFAYTSYLAPGPGHPPFLVAWLTVERLPIGGCQAQSKVLTYTYEVGTLLALTHSGDDIVIAYGLRSAPPMYVQVPRSVRLFHVSADTLEQQRTSNNELRLGMPLGNGGVTASHLEFVGQSLVVHGHKTDTLDSAMPEEGSGPFYKATFENFLSSTTPPSILASESPTTELAAEELHDLEARRLDPVAYESPFTAERSQYIPPFRVRNCWYVMHRRWSYYSSPSSLYVDRLPVGDCTAQRLQVGYSASYRFMVAVKQGQLALAWTVDTGPYWFPSLALELTHVDARTMQRQRTANTRLSVPIGWSPNGWTGGNVIPEQLDFDGHRLVVQGTKSGTVQEVQEIGSGSNFTATFEHFLSSDAPPSVVAY